MPLLKNLKWSGVGLKLDRLQLMHGNQRNPNGMGPQNDLASHPIFLGMTSLKKDN
jgi:hypothetical protein